MGKISNKQRRFVVAEKLMDLGNLIFIGLVVAQFVPRASSVQWVLLFFGLILLASTYLVGDLLMKSKGGE
jgi:hypothetical protein